MPKSLDEIIAAGYRARREGRLDEALQHYRTAVSILEDLKNPRKLAHAVRHVGDILMDAGQPVFAVAHYEGALAIYREHHPPILDLANTLAGYARCHEALGNLVGAQTLWREAKEVYTAAGVQPGVDEANRRLAYIGPHLT